MECNVDVTNLAAHQRSNVHKTTVSRTLDGDLEEQVVATAFKNRKASFRINNVDSTNILDFLRDQKKRFVSLVEEQLAIHTSLKTNLEVFGGYTKMGVAGGVEDIKSRNVVVTESSDLGVIYDAFVKKMSSKSDEFMERDSGWTIKQVLYLEININKYQPMRGLSYIELPKWIRDKGAAQNNDDACFAWCVVAALLPADFNPHRVSSYPHYPEILNLNGINFSMEFKNIPRLEEQNDVSVNVFGIERKSIVGSLHFTASKRDRHVNLLYIQEGDKEHFCLIKNLNGLVRTQLSTHGESKWLCDGCLIYF